MIYIKLEVSEKKFTSNGGLPWAVDYYLFNTNDYDKSKLGCKIYPCSLKKETDGDGCILVFPEEKEKELSSIVGHGVADSDRQSSLLTSLGYRPEGNKYEISKDPSDFYKWLDVSEEIIDAEDILKRLIIIEDKINY